MKIKILTWIIVIILINMGFSCQKNLPQPTGETQRTCVEGGTPAWMKAVTETIQANGYKGEIIRYTYNGKYVFLVNGCLNCADFITVVYNCNQEIICQFGGIAGFNTCPDFSEKASDEKVIWRN